MCPNLKKFTEQMRNKGIDIYLPFVRFSDSSKLEGAGVPQLLSSSRD